MMNSRTSYLVEAVAMVLALTTPGDTGCTDRRLTNNSHMCEVEIVFPDDPRVGFLHPSLCVDDVEYPYTFLAYFFEIPKESDAVRFHLHEYYLHNVKVGEFRKSTLLT